MSVAPAPAVSTLQMPAAPVRHWVKPYTTADAEFAPKPTPAHKIIAKKRCQRCRFW